MIRYGAGGVSARIEAVEKLVHLNDDVPDDPAQLEDEIIRGARGSPRRDDRSENWCAKRPAVAIRYGAGWCVGTRS